ncbi:hypothetical protein BDR05DRAFT_965374, partial [Suillus weaverae]
MGKLIFHFLFLGPRLSRLLLVRPKALRIPYRPYHEPLGAAPVMLTAAAHSMTAARESETGSPASAPSEPRSS